MPAREITAATAGTWTVGDLAVNRMGFGAKRLAGSTAAGDPGATHQRDRPIGVLRRAIELGVNHIDTASFSPTYAHGREKTNLFTELNWANELIHRALAPYPTTWSSARRWGRAPTVWSARISCAVRSRRTCASWAVTTLTW